MTPEQEQLVRGAIGARLNSMTGARLTKVAAAADLDVPGFLRGYSRHFAKEPDQ